MTYYIYENWQAGRRKAVIHRADCRHCNNGRGRSNGGYDPAHATWHGPYKDVDAAKEARQRLDVIVRKECEHCIKWNN